MSMDRNQKLPDRMSKVDNITFLSHVYFPYCYFMDRKQKQPARISKVENITFLKKTKEKLDILTLPRSPLSRGTRFI